MYRVTIEIDFCYGHRLLDYQGKCAHPHGHNGRGQIDVERRAVPAGSQYVAGIGGALGGGVCPARRNLAKDCIAPEDCGRRHG